MEISIEKVEEFLTLAKKSITNDKYRIELNTNREENLNLFIDYLINEKKVKEILTSLTYLDFVDILINKRSGKDNKYLYVFGKDVMLTSRFGCYEVLVNLYIKLYKTKNCYVYVISFHKQKYPIKYYFK